MGRPLVSVVVPTFDRLTCLPAAVASVQQQTRESWELIVVDDGSTDGTREWVSSLGDQRLQFIRCDHTGNIATVRNVGVQAASGEWVAFLDSDDRWRPDKLARQFARLALDPDRPWCYGGYELVDPLGRVVPRAGGKVWHPFEGWIADRILETEAGVTVQTLLVRAELAKRLQFDPRIPLGEDYDFAIRLATAAPGCVVADILTDVLVHDGRTTSSSSPVVGYLGKVLTYRKAARTLADPGLRRIARRQRNAHALTLMRLAVRHGAVGDVVKAIPSIWRV